jgi:simple sugar transport system substrate-binding protein
MTTSRPFALRLSVLGLCIAALLLPALAGCGGSSEGGGASGPLTIGFIYVGPKDDYGYNQAHAQGAAAVKQMKNVKVAENENVPETVDVQKTMKSMIIDDGAKLIFPTSFGYFDPHVLEVAKEYPDVMFLHCGGLWDKTKHPKNVGSYFGYIDECQYLSGIVAAHATQSKKLGFVAAKKIPQVLRNINAFTLGARSIDPDITCMVIFTGTWSDSVKEAEATNTLIDQGVDVLTCHVDSPKVVVGTAEARGVKTCGYHASQASLAPKGYLTGAEWNWEKVYTDYVRITQEGKTIPNMLRGGLKEQIVRMSPYTALVSPKARQAADAVKKQFLDGTFVIFKGPLEDNTGKTVIPRGTSYVQTAIELESMNYLVKGVAAR